MARRLFDAETNRLYYGRQLAPEPGYTLEFAVGMTYSLEPNVLLGIPLSLGVLGDWDHLEKANPLCLLEGLRKSSSRMAVFCNAGSIHAPKNAQPLHLLLDSIVFPIALGAAANFHPKLWVARYVNQDGNRYLRVVVLSRNMTLDRSLDVAATLTGTVGTTSGESNRPLADLLRFVSGYADPVKRKLVRALGEDVLRVAHFSSMDCFDQISFLPFGIPGYKRTAKREFSEAKRLLVISPFLSDSVTARLTSCAKETALITRKASVTPDLFRQFQSVYMVKDLVLGNDLLEEGEGESTPRRELHAKVFYLERYDGKFLYLGSLNASANAFYHNVEFMLKLRYRPYYASFESVLQDFVPEEHSPFALLDAPPSCGETEEAESPDVFRDVVNVLSSARVSPAGSLYTVALVCGVLSHPCEIALLGMDGHYLPLSPEVVFEGVPLTALSEFYVVRRGAHSAILKVPTAGIPIGERDNEIYNAIIGNRAGFFRYISFLLADDSGEVQAQELLSQDGAADSCGSGAYLPGVYERLLRAAAEHPERLCDVEELTRRLTPDIVEDSFRKLLSVCRRAAEQGHRP